MLDKHSEYVILLAHCNNGCTNAPQSYVIHVLPVLFFRAVFLNRQAAARYRALA